MFKLIKLIPIETHFNTMKYSKVFTSIAIVFSVLSLYLLFTKPLNYGIDFSGGILMEIKTPTTANIEQIRNDLKERGHIYGPRITIN